MCRLNTKEEKMITSMKDPCQNIVIVTISANGCRTFSSSSHQLCTQQKVHYHLEENGLIDINSVACSLDISMMVTRDMNSIVVLSSNYKQFIGSLMAMVSRP